MSEPTPRAMSFARDLCPQWGDSSPHDYACKWCVRAAHRLDVFASSDTAELRAEVERLKQEHSDACQLVAQMHAAAVGEVTGPRRGVVEDVEDAVAAPTLLLERNTELRAEVERLTRERDAAVAEEREDIAQYVGGYGVACYGPTKTIAELAAAIRARGAMSKPTPEALIQNYEVLLYDLADTHAAIVDRDTTALRAINAITELRAECERLRQDAARLNRQLDIVEASNDRMAKTLEYGGEDES